MSIQPDPDVFIARLAEEFSIPEDVLRRMYDPRILHDIAASVPVKVPVAQYISAAMTIFFVAILLMPIMAILIRVSFSVAAHAWVWVSF